MFLPLHEVSPLLGWGAFLGHAPRVIQSGQDSWATSANLDMELHEPHECVSAKLDCPSSCSQVFCSDVVSEWVSAVGVRASVRRPVAGAGVPDPDPRWFRPVTLPSLWCSTSSRTQSPCAYSFQDDHKGKGERVCSCHLARQR